MPAPLEIMVGPAEVWVAPPGTEFPKIDAAPTGNWSLIGTLGSQNYGENGVIIRFSRTTNSIRVAGATTPRKHIITETGFQVEFTVIDATPEQLALGFGLDPDDIDEVAAGVGTAGEQSFGLPDDPVPFARAVLVRVPQSPLMEGGNTQIEIPMANQVGNAEGSFAKADAFQLTHIWDAVKTDQPIAIFRVQSAAAQSGD